MSDLASEPRAKRQKIDKHGRFAALAKLKELKGSKHKYEVSEEVDNVYEEIDEKEYAKRMLSRATDDWIEDDGTGYVDDGRDIFDDDEFQEEASHAKKSKKSKKDDKKRNREGISDGKGSLKSLFSNIVPKKKEAIKLDDDDILADILGEINNDKPSSSKFVNQTPTSISSVAQSTSRKVAQNDEKLVKEYMESFSKNLKKKVETNKHEKANSSDDEMIDRLLKPAPKPKKVVPIAEPIQISEIEEVETSSVVIAPAPIKPKTPVKKQTKITFESPVKVIKTPTKLNDDDADLDNMDFSILDDAENQINYGNVEKEVPQPKPVPKEEFVLDGWNNIKLDNPTEESTSINETSSEEFQSDNQMRIWFWDAWEDPIKSPGNIYLFGRVTNPSKPNEFSSCCVHIKGVERCLFLLPSEYIYDVARNEKTTENVKMTDVYAEFNEKIAPEYGIESFRSRKVVKKFSFSVPYIDVPEECEYLEIRYDAQYPAPKLGKKYRSIMHIFGTTTSPLETFLLDHKIKGPCWLTIKNFTVNERPLSWCKVELTCPNAKSIELADTKKNPVPLTILTLNIRTALNPKTHKNEIVMIGCLVNNQFHLDKPPGAVPFQRHFCGLSRPTTQIWPNNLTVKLKQFTGTTVTKLDSERALLGWFLATYQKIDADLIITHDANDCQLDVICDRLMSLKINLWSRIGRLKMTTPAGNKYKDFFTGRMICDIKMSAEELIKSKSYDLHSLCVNVLKIPEDGQKDISNDELYAMYENIDDLFKLVSLTMQDCLYTIRIMCELNALPLALQITTICGNLMSRTLQGGRSERNEFYLLHAFNEKNFIVPDKKVRTYENRFKDLSIADETVEPSAGPSKKAAYSGGLVLDPIKGFYDKYILLMDFNSLYPSIIQEYNICFTTINQPAHETDIPKLPETNIETGVLPTLIRVLVENRRNVKNLMNSPDTDPDRKKQYNIRQLALKLTANSMYGCLGFSNSRFFAQHLAALITQKGREILMHTKTLVQKLQYEVVYGDTDSIMINTNSTDYEQVYKIGSNIKQSVNKIYKQLELDIDGVFKRLLLLKKKKYAALTIEKGKNGEFIEKQELKGIDIVRRDWSEIACFTGREVIKELMSENTMDTKIENIRIHLEEIGRQLRENLTPIPMLVITKQLTKQPKDYTNLTSAPHVAVALRMNATRNKRFKKGDVIGYIICLDGTDNAAMKRAYHIEELKSREELKVDTEYYLQHQVHVVVARLLEVIQETDAYRIAEWLGIDPTKYKNTVKKPFEETEYQTGESIVEKNIYGSCNKFTFKCIACGEDNEISAPFRFDQVVRLNVPVLSKCKNIECKISPYRYVTRIQKVMMLAMRDCIKRFYENWLLCDNPACNSSTRYYTHITNTNRPVCMHCNDGVLHRQYTPQELTNQFYYYQLMFDLSKCDRKIISKLSPDVVNAYAAIKQIVDQMILRSGFCVINLKQCFDAAMEGTQTFPVKRDLIK